MRKTIPIDIVHLIARVFEYQDGKSKWLNGNGEHSVSFILTSYKQRDPTMSSVN